MNHLIFGGVFERHPELRLLIVELPGSWWKSVSTSWIRSTS